MTTWAFQVKFANGKCGISTINVKARLEQLETLEEERKRVVERIKSRYRRRGLEIEVVNLGVKT